MNTAARRYPGWRHNRGLQSADCQPRFDWSKRQHADQVTIIILHFRLILFCWFKIWRKKERKRKKSSAVSVSLHRQGQATPRAGGGEQVGVLLNTVCARWQRFFPRFVTFDICFRLGEPRFLFHTCTQNVCKQVWKFFSLSQHFHLLVFLFLFVDALFFWICSFTFHQCQEYPYL